ncbi:hypothetical protein I7I51_03091 [Histoplasma capsulatum]|uniref:Uncharacterized protein n=2 Tax=Histoplasma TaxID=5036 RepID=A0A8A1MM16_AJECA|nr:hypothetical protein I7I51_03091 [Histoplasma capsulatum]
MTDANAENNGDDVADVVDEEGDSADLADDFLVAVEGGDGDALGEGHEEEREVVEPGVDGVEEVETEASAVEERQEEGDGDDDGADEGTRDLFAPVGVADERDHRLDKGVGRAEADQHDGEEEHDAPEGGRRHLGDGQRVGQEADGEGPELVTRFRLQAEEADNAEDGEGTDDLVGRVGAGNDDGVLDGIGESGIVGGESSEVAEAHASGEENLTGGGLPDLPGGQLPAVPVGHVHLDALDGIGERDAAAEEDEDHHDGQAHGEVDDAAGEADALEHAEVDDEPDEGGPADGLADEAGARVAGVLEDGLAVVRVLAGNGGDVGDDVLHVELLAPVGPGLRGVEGVAEVDHDPGEDGDVVGAHHVAGEDGPDADAAGVLVDGVEGDDAATAGGLADGDLKDEQRDGQEDEGDEVGEEPLQAVVLEDHGRVAQDVSKADGAAHGRQHEGGAAGPLVTAVGGLLGGRGEDVQDLFEDAHGGRIGGPFLREQATCYWSEAGKGEGEDPRSMEEEEEEEEEEEGEEEK